MKKITSRIVSVILTVVIIAMSLPVVFAAEPTALTVDNIAVWPSIEGEIFFGQKLNDGLSLSGGTVTVDGTPNGTVIPGKFEFVDSNYIPTQIDCFASLKFIPEDTQNYLGFEVNSNTKATYMVNKVTPVLLDEVSNPPVATKVAEAGKRLMTSTISGGALKNPYTGETISNIKWSWVKPITVVNESGYYDAKSAASTGYNSITLQIYVGIEGDADETSITTAPSFGKLSYVPDITWGELPLTGGTAVIKGTTTEVTGTFSVADTWKDRAVSAGEFNVDVKFTPDDETVAMASVTQVAVTVATAPITFETEDGSGIPTITVDYGRKTNDDMGAMLKQYVPENVEIQYIDFNGLDTKPLEHANKTFEPGTYTLTCRGITQNKNYAATMLTFKLVVTPITITPAIEGNGNSMIIRDVSGQYNPKGKFDLYVNDALVLSDLAYNEYFAYEHTSSGNKVFKAVYKPGDDTRYVINDITRTDSGIVLEWNVAAKNTDIPTAKHAYNSAVTLAAPAYDLAQSDKPYYGFAGWEDVNGNTGLTEEQLENAEITFTMPDGNVELNATYKFSLKLFFEWIWARIVQFFNFIINAVKDLFALAA